MCSRGRVCHTIPLSTPGCSYIAPFLYRTMHHSCTGTFGHSCTQNIQGCSPFHSMSRDIHVCSCSDQWLYHSCHALCIDTVDYSCYHNNQMHTGVGRCYHCDQVDRCTKRCHWPQNRCHHSGKGLTSSHSADSLDHGIHGNSDKILQLCY